MAKMHMRLERESDCPERSFGKTISWSSVFTEAKSNKIVLPREVPAGKFKQPDLLFSTPCDIHFV